MNFIKNLFIQLLRKMLRKGYVLDDFAMTSFSQMGEDVILQNIFREKKNGFYVDIGSYHPKQYSNTYIFYLQGWKGINIDAMPGSMEVFKQIRPRDINIEKPIALKKKKITYNMFNHPAVNSFSEKLSKKQDKRGEHVIIKKKVMTAYPLNQILDKAMPKNITIDFMSIDTEGLDFEVLQSNNWEKYAPKVIVVEDIEFDIEKPSQSSVYTFLFKKNYQLIGKTEASLIFKAREGDR